MAGKYSGNKAGGGASAGSATTGASEGIDDYRIYLNAESTAPTNKNKNDLQQLLNDDYWESTYGSEHENVTVDNPVWWDNRMYEYYGYDSNSGYGDINDPSTKVKILEDNPELMEEVYNTVRRERFMGREGSTGTANPRGTTNYMTSVLENRGRR